MVRNSVVGQRSPNTCGIAVAAVRTRKVDGAIVVGVDLVDHVLQLRLGRVLTEGPHDSTELLGSDLSYRVLSNLSPSI